MNKMMMILFCVIWLIGCHSSDQVSKSEEKLLTVQPQSHVVPLYYSGIIEPVKSRMVTSPVDGVIDDIHFHYGDNIKKDQVLFTLSSEKFKTDYKNALMQYLKAKNEYTNAHDQLKASQFLHKNQLISDDDFKSRESSYYNAQLTLVQAQDGLMTLLKQLAVPGIRVDQLTIEHIDQVTQLLNAQGDKQAVHVNAPVSGVALFSMKNASSDDLKKLTKGDQVKQGDILTIVGDTSGFLIHVAVSEFHINHLHLGQQVKITGPAFAETILVGNIVALDHQGQSSNGSVPVFPVDIVVPGLTSAQQSMIHIGMSAKVEIDIDQRPQLSVPLSAIIEEQGQAYLQVQEKKTKQFKKVAVKTGETTMNSVVIESNLQAGDVIRVPG